MAQSGNTDMVTTLEEFEERLKKIKQMGGIPSDATYDNVHPEVLREYAAKNPNTETGKSVNSYLIKNNLTANDAQDLNMREQANLGANIVTKIKDGAEVKVIDNKSQDDWVLVEVDGKKGWVKRKYLITKNGKVIINTSGIGANYPKESSEMPVAIDIPLDEIYPSGSYYDKDEKNKLVRFIDSLQETTGEINHYIDCCRDVYSNLLEETRSYISTFDSYIDSMLGIVKGYNSRISGISSNVEWVAKKADDANASTAGAATGKKFGSSGHGSGSGSDGGSESADPTPVDETPVEQPATPENQALVAAAVGAITFAEITPLYSTLGETTGENSSTTTTYGLLGIENYNGKYYYKIIDKTTGKVYYVEKEKANYEGDAKDVLEVKDPTIRYDTTQLDNENNNAKVINDGRYLVLGQETVTEGEQTYTFAKILDSTDGKTYYMQISDRVEMTTLDALGTGSEE